MLETIRKLYPFKSTLDEYCREEKKLCLEAQLFIIYFALHVYNANAFFEKEDFEASGN